LSARPFVLASGLVAALVLGAPAGGAESQGRRHYFLERSFFFLGHFDQQLRSAPGYYSEADRARDDDEVMFEAIPAPHLFFLNQLGREHLQFGTDKKAEPDAHGPAWEVSFVFLVRLRQHGGFSSPLRNPSFMPRFTVQRLSVRRKKPGDFAEGNWIKVFGPLVVPWGHHSNGGSGCLFLEDDVNADCADPLPPEQRRVNTQNGSFSTNYVRLGYGFEQDWPDRNESFVRKGWSAMAWVELNPKKWGPGALDDAQRRIYGPERIGVSLKGELRTKLFKWDVNWALNPQYEYIHYDLKPAPGASPHRFIVDLTGVKDSGRFRGWGLAARFYQGQDFYNLLFIRDIRRVQIGLVVDPQVRTLKID
jgi:hypothetical protein